MIAYFDTSALVPLLINEPATARSAAIWDRADRMVSVRLVYPETRAVLADAERLGRLTARQLRHAVAAFDSQYGQLDLVAIDDQLARRAGHLAERHRLRGYHAVHLAAADRVLDDDLVVVAGDRALLGAAISEGMAVTDVLAP